VLSSYSVSFVGKVPSGRGSKDAAVTDEQLAEVEYKPNRNRRVEENEKRLRLLRHTSSALREICEASQPPKQRKRRV
jgi:hypothetical protein